MYMKRDLTQYFDNETEKQMWREFDQGMSELRAWKAKRNDYQTAPLEDLFQELQGYGLSLCKESILEEYQKIPDCKVLAKIYTAQLAEHGDPELVDVLVMRIVKANVPAAQSGDPVLIDAVIDEVNTLAKKEDRQPLIEEAYRALLKRAEIVNVHLLRELNGFYNYYDFVHESFKLCRNRNAAFRKLVKDMYTTFEDMDPKLFPGIYKEVKNGSGIIQS